MSEEKKFKFTHLPGKRFLSIEGKDYKENWIKWSMRGRLLAQTFAFDTFFQSYEKDKFALDFLSDPQVKYALQVVSSSDKITSFGQDPSSVETEVIPCSVLSMEFFDRLYDNVVRENGNIKKCFDEFIEDFTVSDELRKMFLSDESNYEDLFTDSEKEEFLYLLFRHICIGGSVCQFEDNVQPYLDVTKALYKDLLSVQKNAETQKLNITSVVFKVKAFDESGDLMYPCDDDHVQNFAYFIVDVLKRHVTVLYHRFGAGEYE